jgi:tetratricopeptide (TPR) repeat protein
MRNSRPVLSAGFLIVVATLAAYWNIQYNCLIGYDDVKYLIENEQVRQGLSFAGIRWALTATYDANWFPITWFSHMLDMSLFGSNPLGHHLENLLLHIGNALLIFTLLKRLTGQIWRSALAAILFALHPLHVESVAWAAERKDVLSTLFFLLTIRAYCNYVSHDRSLRHYGAALAFTTLGLATKPMLVSIPLVLLLLDFWPLGRIRQDSSGFVRTNRALLFEKIPFALLALGSCIITLIVQKAGGTVNSVAAPLFLERVLYPLANYATYLRKLVWPSDLAVIYPYSYTIAPWLLAWSALLMVTVTGAVVVYWRQRPYATMGWCWFVITAIPVAGFVRIGGHSVADRYTYIPSIGLFIAIVWLLADLLKNYRHGNAVAVSISMVVLMSLAMVTRKQATYWKDSITLFNHALAVTTDNWIAHSNLGGELLKYNHNNEALPHLLEAVRINPDASTAQFNLGIVLNKFGERTAAIQAFRASIKANPDYAEAYFQAARTSYETGDKTGAYEMLTTLRRINQPMAEALEKYFVLFDSTTSGVPR